MDDCWAYNKETSEWELLQLELVYGRVDAMNSVIDNTWVIMGGEASGGADVYEIEFFQLNVFQYTNDNIPESLLNGFGCQVREMNSMQINMKCR